MNIHEGGAAFRALDLDTMCQCYRFLPQFIYAFFYIAYITKNIDFLFVWKSWSNFNTKQTQKWY